MCINYNLKILKKLKNKIKIKSNCRISYQPDGCLLKMKYDTCQMPDEASANLTASLSACAIGSELGGQEEEVLSVLLLHTIIVSPQVCKP